MASTSEGIQHPANATKLTAIQAGPYGPTFGSENPSRVAVLTSSRFGKLSRDVYYNDLEGFRRFYKVYKVAEVKDDHQLIIIEDISHNWAEILKELFSIPEHFFRLHWASPVNHAMGRLRTPLGESPGEHFILNYRETLPLAINLSGQGEKYWLSSNAKRPIVTKTRKDRDAPDFLETCDQLISYWGASWRYGWIAILLVDPRPTGTSDAITKTFHAGRDGKNGRGKAAKSVYDREHGDGKHYPAFCNSRVCRPDPSLHEPILPFLRGDGKPGRAVDPENLPQGYDGMRVAAVEELIQKRRDGLSTMFDELSLSGAYFLNSSPLSATWYCRRLVLAKACATVESAVQDTLRLTYQASQGIQNINNFNFDKFEENAWSDNWKGEFFTRLWELREELELLGHVTERNIRVLRRVVSKNEAGLKTAKSNSEFQMSKQVLELQALLLDQDKEDLQEWEDLEKMKDYAFKVMSRTTDSYLQAVQATGASFANLLATSSKKLAYLATLFVPASLCAAVLAIPSFSSGNEVTKFWIFWAVSVPVALLLALFFSPLPLKAKRRWRYWQEGRDPEERARRVREAVLARDENARQEGLRAVIAGPPPPIFRSALRESEA